jgi:DNA processing protein
LGLLNRATIVVVGSRQCSAAGAKLARHFATELGRAGYVVASGLARGIDSVALASALEHGTVAVLPGGFDVVYPPEQEALQAAIAERGCLLSEVPIGFVARGGDRSRVVGALGHAPVDVDTLVRGTGLSIRAVQIALIKLALRGGSNGTEMRSFRWPEAPDQARE